MASTPLGGTQGSATPGEIEHMLQMFDGFLCVLDKASSIDVSKWNRKTYSTAKSWGVYAQKAVTQGVRPSLVEALDLEFVDLCRVKGFKVVVDCNALVGAPSLLMRTLLLNRYTPDNIMPEVWRDLAAEQPPPDSAALDARGNRRSGADVLREELDRVRRLDARLDAAEAISDALDAAAGALAQAEAVSAAAARADRPGAGLGSSMPLASYRSAQMLVSGRLLHDEMCRQFSSEGEVEPFVRGRVVPYAENDLSCLELLGWMLLATVSPAVPREKETDERALLSRSISARLHAVLVMSILTPPYRERLWQLHPWLLAALSEAHFSVCAAYTSHLLVQTAAAVRRLSAHLSTAPGVASVPDALRPIELADDEHVRAIRRRWSELLLRHGRVAHFCQQVLAEFKQSCATEVKAVLDAAFISQLVELGTPQVGMTWSARCQDAG